ncbi:hypothetical protein SCHPADRAFT_941543 [Schizopora paradoxa]|uniref:DUF6534 domain-containing protein n=1 Tax=Schizopora paradoxa TaxID=27342 RepID=A0A0H2RJM5_9AGAM|nr:hypothetical protein SCHPADRAFT_941543 [Schizopora paradoxa]
MATLGNTVGAVFVGCLLTLLFFGVTITQAVTYFQGSHSDGYFVFVSVIITLLLDILHVLLVSHGTYIYMVQRFGELEDLTLIPWSFLSLILVAGSTIAIADSSFEGFGIVMSKRNILVTGSQPLSSLPDINQTTAVLSLGSFVVSMYAGVRVLRLSTYQKVDEEPWVVYATVGCDLLVDSSIASTLCYYLYRSSTGYKGTSMLLHTIALYVIGTGFITAVWDVLDMVMFAVLRDTIIFGVFYLSLSKRWFKDSLGREKFPDYLFLVYTNALLASLNARPMMQRKLEQKSSYLKSFASDGTHKATINTGTHERTQDSLETDLELQCTTLKLGLESREANTHAVTLDDASMTETLSREKSSHI